jgi:hypothetical protein
VRADWGQEILGKTKLMGACIRKTCEKSFVIEKIEFEMPKTVFANVIWKN